MRCVKSIDEMKENMVTLDGYLRQKYGPEYRYALKLIKNGICFVAVPANGSYRFYPSRFIGYAENTMNRHESNKSKDGRVTNPVISQLLHQDVMPSAALEMAYKNYCESLGFTPRERAPFGIERKFWRMK